MQPVEIRHHQKNLPPECFQATSGVAGAVAQDAAAYAICDPRLNFLKSSILTPDPLAGSKPDPIATIFDGRDKVRQERWIVLPIAIQRRHDRTMRCTDPAAYRCRLTRRTFVPY